MTHRIPLDHLTSDQLDALHDELDALRTQLADTTNDRDRRGWYQDDAERRIRVQRDRAEEAEAQLRLVDAMRQQNLDAAAAAIQRAEQAEAALARVRALAGDMRTWCSPHGLALHYSDAVLAALDGPAQPHPEPTRGLDQ